MIKLKFYKNSIKEKIKNKQNHQFDTKCLSQGALRFFILTHFLQVLFNPSPKKRKIRNCKEVMRRYSLLKHGGSCPSRKEFRVGLFSKRKAPSRIFPVNFFTCVSICDWESQMSLFPKRKAPSHISMSISLGVIVFVIGSLYQQLKTDDKVVAVHLQLSSNVRVAWDPSVRIWHRQIIIVT